MSPQPQQSQQTPQASAEGVVVRGPDGKTYKFPQGTNKASAIQYFKTKGITGAPAATPKAKDDYKPGLLPQLAGDLAGFLKPAGVSPYPGMDQDAKTQAATRAYQEDQDRKAASYSKLYRMAAPVAQSVGVNVTGMEESARHGDERGVWGHALAVPVAYAGVKATGAVLDKVTPETLRRRAAELNTKVLKQAESGPRDYKTSSALQVAHEQIVSTARGLPDKIESVRAAKNAEVVKRAQHADHSGITVDITSDIKPILQDIANNANARGHWTPQLRNQVISLLERVTTQTDMQTGQRVPRPIDKLTVTQTLELEKGLKDLSAFGKVAPTAIENLARRLRGAMNDRLPPDIQRLRAEESRLITARDAARKNWADMLNDKSATGRGILYKGVGPVAVYLALKGIGLGGMAAPFLGTIAVYKALASTPSRTLRAALYARAASLIDGAVGATMGNAGPTLPPQGQGPGQAITGPKGPQGVAGQALTRQNTPQPRNAPFAPASVVSTNEPAAPPRGTALPASATRARAGSGDYVRGDKSVAQRNTASGEILPPEKPIAKSASKQAPTIQTMKGLDLHSIEKVELSDAMVDDAIAKHKAAWAPHEVKMTREEARASMTHPHEDIWRIKTNHGNVDIYAPKGSTKAEAQALAAKVIGQNAEVGKNVLTKDASARSKAMLDRLDSLYERQAKPKSGADRNAIEREITEIKRSLSGEADSKEQSAINKRIADRERLAGKRATASASAPASQVAASGEMVSQGASPELRSIALDAGYKKLSTYEGGSEMVKALRSTAKAMQKLDPSYDEVEKLTEALEILKSLPKEE